MIQRAFWVQLLLLSVTLAVMASMLMPPARADALAYLVNVTVRPGYNFANPDAALEYGYAICDEIAANNTYRQVVVDVKAHFGSSDEYEATYLITQAVNELCPRLIWQLRSAAAHYRSSPPLQPAGSSK